MVLRKKAVCGICGQTQHSTQMIPVEMIRAQLASWLDETHPEWGRTGFICGRDLADARRAHVEKSSGARARRIVGA